MRRLVITVGLPRGGKTTWSRQQGHPIVNPDSLRLALHGQRFFAPAEPLVWAYAQTMVEALFLAGHETVIVDATHVTQKRRDLWLALARRLGVVCVMHLVDTPPSECIRRAQAEGDGEIVPVIVRMAAEWDLPRPESWSA